MKAKFKEVEVSMKSHTYEIKRPKKLCNFLTTKEFSQDLVCTIYINLKLVGEILCKFKETFLNNKNPH